MKVKKGMLQTILEQPLNKLRSSGAHTYQRYHDLFRSIKKLAKPPKRQKEKGQE